MLDSVKITNTSTNEVVYSNSEGKFEVIYENGKKNTLTFENKTSYPRTVNIPKLFKDEDFDLKVELVNKVQYIIGFTYKEKSNGRLGTILVKPGTTRPSVSGDFSDFIKSLAGVTSNNELSSQYNVRG